MATDIKLNDYGDGGEVLIEISGKEQHHTYRTLLVRGHDICLHGGPGRDSPEDKPRRALVHENGDKLIINYQNDYQGGVTINGSVGGVFITGHTTADELEVPGNLTVNGTTTIGDLSVGKVTSGLTVSGNSTVRGNLTVDGTTTVGDLSVGKVTGNLTVAGDTTTVENLKVEENLQVKGDLEFIRYVGSPVYAYEEPVRALSHRPDEGVMVINPNGSFHGGVRVEGATTLGDLTVEGEVKGDLTVEKKLDVKKQLEAHLIYGKSFTINNPTGGEDIHFPSSITLCTEDVRLKKPGTPDLLVPTGPIAMSHGDDEALVINPGGSFAGGVRVEGVVTVPNKLQVGAKDKEEIIIEPETPTQNPPFHRVRINQHTIKFVEYNPRVPGEKVLDVCDVIRTLQTQVIDLQKRVKALESNQ